VFDKFTDLAKRAIVLSQDEAINLGYDFIGTEHLLLGVLREEQGLGARVLESLGITLGETRAEVERDLGHGEAAPTGQIPFTPHAKQALERALGEALDLGHQFIGTEHLLLGVAAERDGVTARILPGRDEVHAAVVAALEGRPVIVARSHDTTVSTIAVPTRDWVPTLVAGVFLAAGLAIGVLLGWAIWG
jgi:ATP-dependent Clp protease ATP-binding subunit ClpA